MLDSRDQIVKSFQKQLDNMVQSIAEGEVKVTLPSGTMVPSGSLDAAGNAIPRPTTADTEITVKGLNGLHKLGYTLNGGLEAGEAFFTIKSGTTGLDASSIILNPNIANNVAKIATSMRTTIVAGVETVVKGNNDMALMFSGLKNLDFDILLTDYSADYDKELSILNKWETKSKNNVTKYSNNEFDSILIKANREIDKAKRKINIIECDKILKEDIPVIYLYNYLEIIACSKNIFGVDLNVFGNIDFKSINKVKNDRQ